MSTGTVIVQNALRNLGAFSLSAPAHAESVALGRDRLNSMMQIWLSWNIVLGIVPLDAAGDELSEPTDTTNAIQDNLSLELAPFFDNGKVIVSQQLRANAATGLAMVKSLYQTLTIPSRVISGTLPKGEGNSQGVNRIVFFGKGNTISN